jgi:hypothetical protein
MAKQENIFVNVVSEFDGKALTKGQKHLSQFDKTVNKLGKTLGAAFAVHKLIQFGTSSVKAFTDSEKSAQALNTTLRNTGSLMAFPDAIAGIKRLSSATGVADDVLTSAFTQLYSSTGDATKAQKELALAVDVARGTGNDLSEVVNALTAGYRGNTKGLANLNAGLDAATLATKDMDAITKQLATLQAGQAAAYAETYAGKLDIIKVAADNAKQSIGEGLVNAIQVLSGDTSITELSTSVQNLGIYLQAVIIRFAELAKMVIDSPVGKFFALSIDGWNKILGINEKVMEVQNEIWRNNTKAYEDASKQQAAQDKINEAYQKRLKLQAAQQKAAVDNAKKLAAAAKVLDRSGTLLDVDQAQIYAALQGKITDQEKLRLDLQLALLTKNADAANTLSQQLLVSQLNTTDLAKTIASLPKALNPFSEWPGYIQDLIKMIAGMNALINQKTNAAQQVSVSLPSASSGLGQAIANNQLSPLLTKDILTGVTPNQAAEQAQANLMAQGFSLQDTASSARYTAQAVGYFQSQLASQQAAGQTITVNIDASSMIDPSNLTKVIQQTYIDLQKGGYSLAPGGYGFGGG